jgi:flavodoxin
MTGCAPPNEPTSQTQQPPDDTDDMTPSAQPSTAASTLLVYFSRPGENYWEGGRRDLEIGNTKRLAAVIAEQIDCDTYEIVAADPYPQAYDPTVERNQQEQNRDARPAIAGELPDLRGYDTVMIGSPIWNVRAPMIMSTFIEGIDLAGKRVLPFVTYAVSGMSGVDQDYRNALPDSDVTDGLAVRGEDVAGAAADVTTWLRANGRT